MLAGMRTWQGSRHIKEKRGAEMEDVVMTAGGGGGVNRDKGAG